MEEFQTWRDLLGELTKKPRDRERIAKAVGTSAETLLQWIRQEANPNIDQLHQLPEIVPRYHMLLRTLIAEEFEELSQATTMTPAPNGSIQATFSAHILNLYNTVPAQYRFWSICTAILSDAIKRFDPEHLGLSISVIQCMLPPGEEIIRYLRESIGIATSPWEEQIEVRTRFLGAESLAGQAISSGQSRFIANISQERRFSGSLPKQAVSTAAFPILYAHRIAGCLLLVSTQQDYFRSPALFHLIQEYVALLTLAFNPEDFHPQERIALQTMPPLQVQQPYLSSLKQRIQATWKTAFSVHRPMSYMEAEQHVWWQVAEELLSLPPPLSPS